MEHRLLISFCPFLNTKSYSLKKSGSINLIKKIISCSSRKDVIDSAQKAVFCPYGSGIRHSFLQSDLECFSCDTDRFDSALFVFFDTPKAMVEGFPVWAILIKSILFPVLGEAGLGIAGFDGTDLDVVLVDFWSEGVEKHIHTSFACAIEALERQRNDSSDG